MKKVSEAYRQSMAMPVRRPSRVEISVRVGSGLAKDGTWTTTSPQTVISSLPSMNLESVSAGDTYATLELNRWSLDGSFQVYREGTPVDSGFVGGAVTDQTGAGPDVVLTRTFSDPRDPEEITIVFDPTMNEWCNLSLKIATTSQEVVVPVVPDGPIVKIPTPAGEGVRSITITGHTAMPQSYTRIQRVQYGKDIIFGGREIVSTHQVDDVDPLARRLPKEELEFTILDFDGKYDPDDPETGEYSSLDKNTPVQLRYGYDLPGGTEWLAPDKYVLTARPRGNNGKLTFKATRQLGALTDQFITGGGQADRKMFQHAHRVALSAGIGSEGIDVDETLKTMIAFPPPIVSEAAAFQMIAHGSRCCLKTRSDGVIQIKRFDPSVPGLPAFSLSGNTIVKSSQKLSKSPALRRVGCYIYHFELSQERKKIWYCEFTGNDVWAIFDRPYQRLGEDTVVTGGTLDVAVEYARACYVRVTGSGTKTLTMYGKELKPSSEVRYSDTYNERGEEDVIKNEMIADADMATALMAHEAAWLQKRVTYDMDYRGNPELEAGDVVSLETRYTKPGQTLKALILRHELTFDGSLHGKVKVKVI